MSQPLNTGDSFPDISLTSTSGDTITVPGGGSNYQVVLFFRGKF